MTGIECRCHPTQRSGSMLLGFLRVEICHNMKMKSCNFVMLGGNHGLSASMRERRKELEYASWASTRRFFLLEVSYVFMEKLQFSDMSVHLGVCLYVMSCPFPPCCSFSKSQEMHEGHACELFWFKLPAMRKLHSCIFHCYYTDGLPSAPNVWKGYFRKRPVFF